MSCRSFSGLLLALAMLSTLVLAGSAWSQGLDTWLPQREFKDRATTNRPAVATLGKNLCMAWHGLEQKNIWVSVSSDNGKTWSKQVELKDRASKSGPALCAVGDHFVMAWRGLDQNNLWVSTSKDGLNWTAQKELKGSSTSDSPALAGITQGKDNLIVMAWKGLDQNNIWVSTSKDGLTWSKQVELKDRASKSGPAITGTVTDKGQFVMAWRGLDQNNIWVSTSKDGLTWSKQVELKDRATKSGPTLTPAGNTLFMVWRGLDQNNLWGSMLKR